MTFPCKFSSSKTATDGDLMWLNAVLYLWHLVLLVLHLFVTQSNVVRLKLQYVELWLWLRLRLRLWVLFAFSFLFVFWFFNRFLADVPITWEWKYDQLPNIINGITLNVNQIECRPLLHILNHVLYCVFISSAASLWKLAFLLIGFYF